MRHLTTSLILALIPIPVFAEDSSDVETTGVPNYTVEVIIFTYAEDVSVGTEIFEPDPVAVNEIPLPAEREPVFEDPAAGPMDVEQQVPEQNTAGREFTLHLEDEFTLLDIANRLERLDVYEPVMHFAWTQPAFPEEETVPVDVSALTEPAEGLTGDFMLYLGRYLHLVVDLTLDDPAAPDGPVAVDEPAYVYGDQRIGFDAVRLDPGRVRFRIQENRIFKNGELRYFDHPKFGVLAKVTRVEQDPDEIEPEMLGDDPPEPGPVNRP